MVSEGAGGSPAIGGDAPRAVPARHRDGRMQRLSVVILHDETGCRPTPFDCLGIQSPQVRASPCKRLRPSAYDVLSGALILGGCRGCCVLKLLFLHWQNRSRIIFYGRLRALRRRRLRGSRAQVGRKRGWIDRREYCALFGFAGKSQKSVNRRDDVAGSQSRIIFHVK